jgi:hypothetical protein
MNGGKRELELIYCDSSLGQEALLILTWDVLTYLLNIECSQASIKR